MMGLDEAAGSPTPWSWASSPTAVSPTPAPPTAPWCHDASPPAVPTTCTTGSAPPSRSSKATAPYGTATPTTPTGRPPPTCPTGSCVSNPFRYTGAEHDETAGLYKIGHRYYQPDHGRWTQPDPLGNRTNPGMPTEAPPTCTSAATPSTTPTRRACLAHQSRLSGYCGNAFFTGGLAPYWEAGQGSRRAAGPSRSITRSRFLRMSRHGRMDSGADRCTELLARGRADQCAR
jgi:RHS repeat-associated protein